MHKYLSQPAWLQTPLPCLPLAAWEAHTSAAHHTKGKYWLVNGGMASLWLCLSLKSLFSPQYVKAV